MSKDTTPTPAPTATETAVASAMGKLPPWALIGLALLGAGGSGVGGSVFGANQMAQDLAAVEAKVDALDDKVDALTLAIVRLNPELELSP